MGAILILLTCGAAMLFAAGWGLGNRLLLIMGLAVAAIVLAIVGGAQ